MLQLNLVLRLREVAPDAIVQRAVRHTSPKQSVATSWEWQSR